MIPIPIRYIGRYIEIANYLSTGNRYQQSTIKPDWDHFGPSFGSILKNWGPPRMWTSGQGLSTTCGSEGTLHLVNCTFWSISWPNFISPRNLNTACSSVKASSLLSPTVFLTNERMSSLFLVYLTRVCRRFNLDYYNNFPINIPICHLKNLPPRQLTHA